MIHRAIWAKLALAALGAAGALAALPAGAGGSSIFIEMQQPPQRYQNGTAAPSRPVWVPGHWEAPGSHRREDSQHRGPDRDRDRDGVPDRYDRDRDGDGTPNRHDRQPDNAWQR